MKLIGNVSILFGDQVVTDQVLGIYRNKWKGYAILPGIGECRACASEEKAFHALLFETTPFTISGEQNEGQLVFEASFKRFPYSINGKREFACFGLRLIPRQGRVRTVEFDGDDEKSVAVNSFSVSSDCFSVDLGNGSLHLEIFLRPMKPQTEIAPPAGFHEEVALK